MSIALCGIDEAGFGPLLGPLTVAMSTIILNDWNPGDPRPDLWKILDQAIVKRPGDRKGRVAIDDSKTLKLANSSKTRDPLIHLEKGVLSLMPQSSMQPVDVAELFDQLGVFLDDSPWYSPASLAVPVAHTQDQIRISKAMVQSALQNQGVEVVSIRCRALCETEFNAIASRAGSKAATTATAIGEHLRWLWCNWTAGELDAEHLRIVCDRQGGRTSYQAMLTGILPGITVQRLEESDRYSRYELHADDRTATITFMPEAESYHLPVALASMAAKLVRELAMRRFNIYWAHRSPEIKPTAGYRLDAARWLKDITPVASAQERAAMIRRV